MKKTETIKNGNVNLKPIKTGIDWVKIREEYFEYCKNSKFDVYSAAHLVWLESRIKEELNQ